MNFSRNILIRTALTLLLVAGISTAAFALDLSEAKTKGLVGEQANGLVGAVSGGDAAVSALIKQTNDGRLQLYREQAANQGVSLEQYQAVAGGNLISRTPAGQYVNTGGGWTKK